MFYLPLVHMTMELDDPHFLSLVRSNPIHLTRAAEIANVTFYLLYT